MTTPDIQKLLQEAIAAAKVIQQTQPSSPQTATKRIYRLDDKRKQREQARQLLLRVLELDEGNIPAWLWLSTVVEEVSEKQVCLENVLILDPANKPAQNGLAHLRQQHPLPPAVSNRGATTSVAQHPCPFCQQPISHLATMCHHCQLSLVVDCPACGRRVDVEHPACPACGQSLGDFRDGPAYFAHLAEAYHEQQETEKALMAWQTVATLQPDYPHLRLRLGELQAAVGRTEAAISALQQAMRQPEDSLSATLALGQIFQELRRWDEAQHLFRTLVSANPEAYEAHFALGWLLMEQGHLRAAFPHLQKTTQLNPQHGQAWLRLAQLQEQFKNPKQAARAYRQASSLLSHHSLDNLRAQRQLQILEPALPQLMSSNWGELLRQMTGPILVCVLAALLDAGLSPWWIPLSGWLAIFLSILGAFLWVSGSSLPKNPLIQQLVGPQGIVSAESQFVVTCFGLFCWLLALSLILLPLGQSFPEVPPL